MWPFNRNSPEPNPPRDFDQEFSESLSKLVALIDWPGVDLHLTAVKARREGKETAAQMVKDDVAQAFGLGLISSRIISEKRLADPNLAQALDQAVTTFLNHLSKHRPARANKPRTHQVKQQSVAEIIFNDLNPETVTALKEIANKLYFEGEYQYSKPERSHEFQVFEWIVDLRRTGDEVNANNFLGKQNNLRLRRE